MRVMALDHGRARCGCAVSDPTGLLATPVADVERPETPAGLARIAELTVEHQVEQLVVGLPVLLSGEEGEQAAAARSFAGRLRKTCNLPVTLYDERFTSRMADRTGTESTSDLGRDAHAAAHLLESYLRDQARVTNV